MNNIFGVILSTCFFFILSSATVFANSPYVLPYPSAMPGSFMYKLHLIQESIEKYWYFGDFGQFEYSLKESDRYLVEAKTLFEYQQYLLADKALKKSDYYFQNIMPSLTRARYHGKDIAQKQILLHQAAQKHTELLEKLLTEVPQEVVWQPEKSAATPIQIKKGIEHAVKIRENSL